MCTDISYENGVLLFIAEAAICEQLLFFFTYVVFSLFHK